MIHKIEIKNYMWAGGFEPRTWGIAVRRLIHWATLSPCDGPLLDV